MNFLTLKELTNQSIFSSVGTLLKHEDLDLFYRYFTFNTDFLKHFPCIIYSFNGNEELVKLAENYVKNIFPDKQIIFIFSENLGHTFGIFLSEYLIFEETKKTNYNYVWKFSNDVIAQENIFNVTVPISDFYYINNLGYNYFIQNPQDTIDDLNQKIKSKKYFYPQTNYYIIKNKINFYPSKDDTYKLYDVYHSCKNKNLKPWDVIPYCDCENFLKKTVEKNNITTHMLLNEEELIKIANIINIYKIWDGSHKNISYLRFGNLCHFQWPEKEIIEI